MTERFEHVHGDHRWQLDYALQEIPPGPYLPDFLFWARRLQEAVVNAVRRPEGRVLDVGCGSGKDLLPFLRAGWEPWGIDPSAFMLQLSKRELGSDRGGINLVRGVAEFLPFPENTFDLVICKGAIDHFADRASFIREAVRVLKPDGRLVIGLANFDGLSCRLGRALAPLWRRLGVLQEGQRPYWEPPDDHTFRGSLSAVLALGGDWARLERVTGVCLMTFFPGWGKLLSKLPERTADLLLRASDAMGRRSPALADLIVAVWRPLKQALTADEKRVSGSVS